MTQKSDFAVVGSFAIGSNSDSFLFLGTGASAGVPLIGCLCDVCKSPSPKNKRLRSSGLLTVRGKKFLIDVGPDFRTQALLYGIDRLDGLLLTHTHFDHIAGIDDLRPFFYLQKRPLPCLLSKESYEELLRRYYYLFHPTYPGESQKVQLAFTELPSDRGKIHFEGIDLSTFSYLQGKMKVNGFRIGDFAYVTDIRDYDPAIFAWLKGTHTLILSALMMKPSPVQFSLPEATEFAQKAGAKQTYITHMTHDIEHEKGNSTLPPNIRLGYDSLHIPLYD